MDKVSVEELYSQLADITHSSSYFTNWARTFRCLPQSVFVPESEEQCELVLELARREGKRIRVVGVGHSPSDLACTSEFMIRTDKLDKIISVDKERKIVKAQGGIQLLSLHKALAAHSLAMINVGSISDQTLAGIITTASHGTGIHFGVMSTDVLSLRLLLSDGTKLFCSRTSNPDVFLASLCGLGATGLILEVEMHVQDSFRLKEVQKSLPFQEVIQNLDTLVHASEHARLWWFPSSPSNSVRTSLASRTTDPPKPVYSWLWHSLMGFHVVQFLLFLGRYFSTINKWTAAFAAWLISMDTVGVDDGWKIFNVDCRYPQYTTEWAIPYANTVPCLLELNTFFQDPLSSFPSLTPRERKALQTMHFPIEIRFSAPDDIWISPSTAQQTCWIGIVQYKPYGLPIPYRLLFHTFERILSSHGGRPHWAKSHPLTPTHLRALYPEHWDDFVRVLHRVDERGMWRNEYIRRHITGEEEGSGGSQRMYKERE